MIDLTERNLPAIHHAQNPTPNFRVFKARLVTSLLLAALWTRASGADLVGENCDLKLPPLNAGYSALMGMPLRVYPSHEVISPSYSGCQVIWVTDGTTEQLEMKIRFEHGKPKQLVGSGVNMSFGECTSGSIAEAAAGSCEVAATLPYRSYARECLKTRTQPADSVGTFIDRKCMQSPDPVPGDQAGTRPSKP